jgi:hypothetical protein
VSAPAGPDDGRVYTPTSGTGTGWVGIALAVVVVVAILVDDRSVRGTRFVLAALVFGLLVWCYMLRPRLVIGRTVLELRNPFSSWFVPLATIDKVAVRAVTMVHTTDERRYDGVAVGRPVRSLVRGRTVPNRSIGIPGLGGSRASEGAAASRVPKGRLDANMVANLVVEQILFAAEQTRATREPVPAPQRTWAVVELAALGLLVAAFAVSLLL